MRTIHSFAALAGLTIVALPAAAAERGFTVTSFDRIRVEGPYAVTVTSGRGPSVRATGSPQALDAVIARVDGRTLVIQRSTGAWTAFPGQDRGPVTIAVTAPRLGQATLAGSGSLDVDAMRDARIDLILAGSGRIAVGRIETDLLGATVSGSGGMTLAGRAANARVALRGSGQIEAEGLQASDAIVTADGSGDVALRAVRTASVTAAGSGTVRIAGTPACTVKRTGSGEVTCGRQP